MTENEIKEMYKSLANGDDWECKCNGYNNCTHCEVGFCPDENWRPYKLGEAIHENFEYRKIEKWCVTTQKEIFELDLLKSYETPIFVGSKKECEKWIKGYMNKTWLEEKLNEMRKSSTEYTCTELDMYELGCENGIIEACKKILEEVDKNESHYYFSYFDVRDIINDLGVEV